MPSKAANRRRALAHELLGLHRKNASDISRMEDIKRELREIATEGAENFKEEFAGEGVVKVAGKKPAEFKGIIPEVDAPTFLALTDRKRASLTDAGVIKMTEKYGQPFYGSVSVQAF